MEEITTIGKLLKTLKLISNLENKLDMSPRLKGKPRKDIRNKISKLRAAVGKCPPEIQKQLWEYRQDAIKPRSKEPPKRELRPR